MWMRTLSRSASNCSSSKTKDPVSCVFFGIPCALSCMQCGDFALLFDWGDVFLFTGRCAVALALHFITSCSPCPLFVTFLQVFAVFSVSSFMSFLWRLFTLPCTKAFNWEILIMGLNCCCDHILYHCCRECGGIQLSADMIRYCLHFCCRKPAFFKHGCKCFIKNMWWIMYWWIIWGTCGNVKWLAAVASSELFICLCFRQ